MSAHLIWEKKDGSRIDFPLTSNIMIVGRDEGVDIRVDDSLVSRSHARIERQGEHYVVKDLGSTNHTRVNGAIVNEQRLRHGDQVSFARIRCFFFTEE